LFNRDYSSPEEAKIFLNAQPPADVDPFNMKYMPEAVDRILFAIHHHQPIAIYGDYDADGVTATALLVQYLKSLNADVREYIPNRFDEGYGVNRDALTSLFNEGIKLVITVDCGMRSVDETEHARELGLDLIITDHHHPGEKIPRALAIINPKQPGDTYPYKDLAGVGLAYKLTHALSISLDRDLAEVESNLDLVAIGTVVDMAPLTGENRYLVRQGLLRMRQPARQGIMALIGVSGLKADRLKSTDLGFGLGPRLNAAGRLDSALAAYRLLSTQDLHETGRLAQDLDIQNRERQKITREIQSAAEIMALEADPQALLIFASHPDFNPGVVGLAASRLCEQYYRPAIVAHTGNEVTVGSCRSIPELNITAALDECSELMERYGGHTAAAGFTIRNDKLPKLIEKLKEIICRQLDGLDLRPVITADAEVSLTELKPDLLEYLDLLQPTGLGNPLPVFCSRNVRVQRYLTVGRESEHLKLVVTDGRITYDAIAFRQGYWFRQMPPIIDMMFTFEKNEFNGRTTLQLNVRDLKASE
jgi:single-stranded-DNA-specific exonuclease